jgi:hypothetical protein
MIYLDFDGKWLARFRKWIDGLPDRDFKKASVAEKCVRLLLIGTALAVIAVPIWFLMRP